MEIHGVFEEVHRQSGVSNKDTLDRRKIFLFKYKSFSIAYRISVEAFRYCVESSENILTGIPPHQIFPAGQIVLKMSGSISILANIF